MVNTDGINSGVAGASDVISSVSIWFGNFVSGVSLWFSEMSIYEIIILLTIIFLGLLLLYLKARVKDKVKKFQYFH